MRYYKVRDYDVHCDDYQKLIYFNGELIASYISAQKPTTVDVLRAIATCSYKGENVC